MRIATANVWKGLITHQPATFCTVFSPSLRSGERPSGVLGDFQSSPARQPMFCSRGSRGYTSPLQAKRNRVLQCAAFGLHRTRGTTVVAGTGSAVRPVILCLSAQGFSAQPIRRSRHPDGLKLFRLSRALIFDLAQLWSFGAKSGPGRWPDAPTGVSAHRGFHDCPFCGGRGVSIPAEMSDYIFVERSPQGTVTPSPRRNRGVRSIMDLIYRRPASISRLTQPTRVSKPTPRSGAAPPGSGRCTVGSCGLTSARPIAARPSNSHRQSRSFVRHW